MSVRDTAVRLSGAAAAHAAPPAYADGRWRIGAQGQHEIWALDSVGKLVPGDVGRILLIGSHGGLHGGRPDSALDFAGRPVVARAAAFNDAGVGIDQVGITRLPELERRGIPAVTVSHATARIGDGRSMIGGLISHANALAAAAGARPGMHMQEWISCM